MKVIMLILMTFLLTSCSGRGDKKGNSNNEFVEVYEEPSHQLVFEHKDFKIMDIQIKPGDTTLFHRHKNPMFYVSLGWQENASQLLNAKWIQGDSEEWPTGEMDVDSSYLTNPIIHKVTNVGTKPSRLIGILNTSDGLKSNNESNTTQFTNKWFRSKRIELNANEELDYQQLEFPTILINVSENDIELTKENITSSHKLKWLVVEEMTQLKNSTNNQIEMIQIEVLK
ncbi:hypothetical protein AB8P51_15145 [Muriicola sp. SD30]|uniref:hypothetical protein n=1 Tax=Muriicola sp. SD30 TaxID=3240936 RepID=UPI003510D0C1